MNKIYEFLKLLLSIHPVNLVNPVKNLRALRVLRGS